MSDKAKTIKERSEISAPYRWNLEDIYSGWDEWQVGYDKLEGLIDDYAKLKGSLSQGAKALEKAMLLDDELGELSYRVYFYTALMHDEDQRINEIDAKRQQVQILFAKAQEASSWFRPELLAIDKKEIDRWLDEAESKKEALATYRFALTEIFRQQEHVLDDAQEALLSLSSRLASSSGDTYGAITTADMRFPVVKLSTGEEETITYGKYRALLATCRVAEDRAAAFKALYDVYRNHNNTYASIYNGVCQRDYFYARARKHQTTLDAALDSNHIPPSVVENLIDTTRKGHQPLQRYHRLRKKVLGLKDYHLYDGSIPLVDLDKRYPYDDVKESIVESVALLGKDYQRNVRQAFENRWIDVYENKGKRSGAYSAPVYGTHPYMLLNYNDTLDDVFTLAHEMGHSMHTILSHQSQPFAYASYTIFVAEVASTLNEALLLDYMLERTSDPKERALLLQHAIDGICGTFYTQVLFADWELAAHREVEAGKPLTADRLNELYLERLDAYYGDILADKKDYEITWSRIPHFFRSPYYVYQYATCFASSAQIMANIQNASDANREKEVQRYLDLLRAGSSNHPMTLLQNAGADLSKTQTVQAVINKLDRLVAELEECV